MRGFCYLGLALLVGVCAREGIAATARKTAARKAPSKSAAAGRTTPGVRKKGASTRRAAGKSARPAVTWRNRQSAPTADRYKEIQGALAAKGYLNPQQATGQWDQNSTDALRRFQADQNLEASGKITSMSLIALGLGPRHENPLPPKPLPPDAPPSAPATTPAPASPDPPSAPAPVDHLGQ